MMMRPPSFMCFSAACVAMNMPRILMSITRSSSSSVVSSNFFGIAVPALFTSTSSPPKVATVFSIAALTASASVASAWMVIDNVFINGGPALLALQQNANSPEKDKRAAEDQVLDVAVTVSAFALTKG